MSNQAERTQIAVLQNDMLQVKSDVSEIKGDIKSIKSSLSGTYATTKQLEETEQRLTKNKNVERFLVIVFSVVLTFLVGYFLNHIGKVDVITTPGTTSTTTSTTNPPAASSSKAPSASASAKSTSTSDKPSDSQSVVDGVVNQVPKVP